MSAPSANSYVSGEQKAPWRLLSEDGVGAAAGLAADEMLTARVGAGYSEPVLRLYTYAGAALVGRFQNLSNELRQAQCRARGMEINRRPTGGGAIVMGPEQLGVALALPLSREESHARNRELMGRFATALIAGLETFGIQAEFRGKNDLEVGGRKLAGLGVFRHPQGGILFHASVLVHLDVGLMLEVLNTPFEKITDKEIATVAARVSTVSKETGANISTEAVRRSLAEGFARVYQAKLAPAVIAPVEEEAAWALVREKYQSEGWVFQTPEVADHFGSARVKTPQGLLDIRVTLAGEMMKAVFICGDFFADEGALAALENSLRWHSSRLEAIQATLERIYREQGDALSGLPQAALAEALTASVRQGGAEADPYGCFANPQGC